MTGRPSTGLAHAPTRRGHIRAVDVDVDESRTVTSGGAGTPLGRPQAKGGDSRRNLTRRKTKNRKR